MLPRDIFLRLPRPTALLLLSSLISLTSAHVARQTPTTIPHRDLDVVLYPPLPVSTSPPLGAGVLHELLRRQATNTVCGYINGDSALPATCSAGSHCVLETVHSVIGCCPDGQDTCTAGVFTGCVDSNRSPQTEVDPYVYTCTGSSVCYKNVFDGGYSQFGCGTASSEAATVAASASGISTQILFTTESVSFTESATSLLTPTPIGTGPSTFPSVSLSPNTSSSSTTSSSTSKTTTRTSSTVRTNVSTASSTDTSSTSAATSTADAAPPLHFDETTPNSGAIIGGSIGGVVALAAVIALCTYRSRRRAGNARKGPGPRPGDTQYISPVSEGFKPIPDGTAAGGAGAGAGAAAVFNGKTIRHMTGEPDSRNTVWQHGNLGGSRRTSQFLGPKGGVGVASSSGGAGGFQDTAEDDQTPLRTQFPETNDFTRHFNESLSRIGEEDENSTDGGLHRDAAVVGNADSHGDLGGSRPLWLQSKRQSRNVMWT